MKHILFYILLAVMILPSCDSMLDEDTYGASTEENMLKNEDNIILMVGQAYADIKWLHDHWGYWGVNTLTSDECVCPVRMPGGHWNDGGYWKNMNNHRWTAEDDAFENLWNQSISGAVLCNKIIQTLSNNKQIIPDVLYAQYVGELEVVRSYYFYTLFDSFGRIPYTEKFEENTSVPLLSAAETWAKLVECLERNAQNLPIASGNAKTENYGRATQGLAYALLARLYLNAESYGVTCDTAYNRCVEVCDLIINSGAYAIEDNFFSNFKIDNASSKENIFVIVEDGNENFDRREIGSMMNKLRVTMLSLHYSHQQAWGLLEKPWNGFCAPPEFIAKYDDLDKRGTGKGYETNGTKNVNQYGWFVGGIYNQAGTLLKDENGTDASIVTQISSLDSAKWYEGARLQKYEIDKNSTYKYCENDFVLFRYADVLYMQYEACLRGGTPDRKSALIANSDFQKIRTRVGLAPYTEATLTLNDEILNERGREFAWENIRRRDLIRFGYFDNGAWSGWGTWRGVASGDKLNWFPIPGPILRKAGGIWTQNDGY